MTAAENPPEVDENTVDTESPENDRSREAGTEPADGVQPEADAGQQEDTDHSDDQNLSKDELLEALNTSRVEVQEMKDGFLRAKAEMENIRRRSQNEVIAARKYAIEGFATELLNVKDSLDQAALVQLEEADQGAMEKMQEGLTLTLKQLETAMGKFSVEEVEAGPGVKFDPERHQAISMVASEEVESNHIIDVMQKGFMLKDRLLRPAMVVVAS